MDEKLIALLEEHREQIEAEWLRLLRHDQTSSFKQHSDLLRKVIRSTLTRAFAQLREQQSGEPRVSAVSYELIAPDVGCSRNPVLNFMLAGEAALLLWGAKALFAQKADFGGIGQHDLAELYVAMRALARAEVSHFCFLCYHDHGCARISRDVHRTAEALNAVVRRSLKT